MLKTSLCSIDHHDFFAAGEISGGRKDELPCDAVPLAGTKGLLLVIFPRGVAPAMDHSTPELRGMRSLLFPLPGGR
jgi:hypothetical protein